jgi:hypothetical protein
MDVGGNDAIPCVTTISSIQALHALAREVDPRHGGNSKRKSLLNVAGCEPLEWSTTPWGHFYLEF